MHDLTEHNIKKVCSAYRGCFANASSSFLTDILNLLQKVKFTNRDVTDYWVQIPKFEVHNCSGSLVVKIDLNRCSDIYKRQVHQACGMAFKRIFYLDHVSIHQSVLYFYSTNIDCLCCS